ncbi:helix-turn-helix domain-containing protein [Streptococcus alactolyticus]|uniref:helix-turn-helix domain-containing protein n=1 Tax=Streptococcus alactolyticus TaxID=29389 RepID=UPI00143F278E|nr:helix-turn-helix transcriptional regulator [Streptococcus alactolyticus]NKN41203.1 helix-turn-helix transcriptional regulator [Streptococcus alactolyticus]NKN85623.1 helix-turn-helix transcriptional regulator [Streptococcus agalactiae]
MGNRLKELRKTKGLTLDELSKELKKKHGVLLSTGQLSSYENGKRSPREENTWRIIAEYFKVPISYLLGYDDNLTIGDAVEILEAVYAGDIPSNDEIVKKIIAQQKKTGKEAREIVKKINALRFKRGQEIAQQAYEKYKDFDLVSNIKVLTVLLENCDNIYTNIIRYVSPRLVQNELTETELKSLNTFISLLEEHGKEFKDTADSFSKRLNADLKTTPTDND